MRQNKKSRITINDLKMGMRARITTTERSALSGKSVSTYERRRRLGTDIPYQRDPSGTIWYAVEDVLLDLALPVHRSTAEYDCSSKTASLEKARSIKKEQPVQGD
jgi:hypothetical protein